MILHVADSYRTLTAATSPSRLATYSLIPYTIANSLGPTKSQTSKALMAPALSSNAFHLATGYHHGHARPSKPTFTVCSRAKGKDGPSEVNEGSGKPNQFAFDFSKITADAKALIPVTAPGGGSMFAGLRRKDPNAVFVAGATGQAGSRIAQMLLREGFAVRAGVPELGSAQELVRLAATYKIISPTESKRLNAVESTFEDPESIAKAIGPASKVVVTVGSAEDGPAGAVTTDDALNVVRAASLAAAGHVAIIYDSSDSITSPSTNNVLDGITSFISNFSNLFAKSRSLSLAEFLEKLVEYDVNFTVIKAAIAEDYDGIGSVGDGILVQKEEAITETKVAKSQIAKLIADVFADTSVAENKVVTVSTSPSATSKPIAELFSAIPEDGRRKAYAEALAKSKAEGEALSASEKAQEAINTSKKLVKETKKSSEQEAETASLAGEAKAKAEAVGATLDGILSKAKDFGGNGFSWEKLSSQLATAVPQKAENGKPKTQVATVRGQAKARSLTPKKAVVKQSAPRPKPMESEAEAKTEVRKVFGGLFKQEIIYMDE